MGDPDCLESRISVARRSVYGFRPNPGSGCSFSCAWQYVRGFFYGSVMPFSAREIEAKNKLEVVMAATEGFADALDKSSISRSDRDPGSVESWRERLSAQIREGHSYSRGVLHGTVASFAGWIAGACYGVSYPDSALTGYLVCAALAWTGLFAQDLYDCQRRISRVCRSGGRQGELGS